MVRGTFAHATLHNEALPGPEGGFARHVPSGETLPVYDAAIRYGAEGTPLVVIAGADYGMRSSRDWAGKGTRLLGIRAVIAESFERIHRSNLVGMGVLPLQFPAGTNRKTLKLDGSETLDIAGVETDLQPRMKLPCRIHRRDGTVTTFQLDCRIDTQRELEWYRHGGVLNYVLHNMH